jgi:hypothetical protein
VEQLLKSKAINFQRIKRILEVLEFEIGQYTLIMEEWTQGLNHHSGETLRGRGAAG